MENSQSGANPFLVHIDPLEKPKERGVYRFVFRRVPEFVNASVTQLMFALNASVLQEFAFSSGADAARVCQSRLRFKHEGSFKNDRDIISASTVAQSESPR